MTATAADSNERTVLLGSKPRASGQHKGIIAAVIVLFLVLGAVMRLRGQSQETPYAKVQTHLGRVEPEKNEFQTNLWKLQQLISDMGHEQEERRLKTPSLSIRDGHLSEKTDAEVVQDVVKDMVQALQHKGEAGMKMVLANAAPSNPAKLQAFSDVIKEMRGSKKAVLLGKFLEYDVKKPKDDNTDKRQVDVVVKAPFDIMHISGLRSADIGRDTNDKSLRTATFRWRMLKGADSAWQTDGFDLIPPGGIGEP